MLYPDEQLLSISDICDTWAVTRTFILAHAAHAGRAARSLPELPAVVVSGKLMFEPYAVRYFFRAYRERLKLVRKRQRNGREKTL